MLDELDAYFETQELKGAFGATYGTFEFPEELVCIVLEKLSLRELQLVGSTSRFFRRLTKDNFLWISLVQCYFSDEEFQTFYSGQYSEPPHVQAKKLFQQKLTALKKEFYNMHSGERYTI